MTNDASKARAAAVAEALTRRQSELERMVRRRFPVLDAPEVYQRTAVRALERFEALQDLDRVDAWVRRIMITSALDLLRDRRRRELTSDPDETERLPAPTPASDEDNSTCGCSMNLLDSLTTSYADVLRRVDIEGDSLDETADALHIDKGNATVRLHRARRALRGRLRDHCGVTTMRQCLSCTCAERGTCASPA